MKKKKLKSLTLSKKTVSHLHGKGGLNIPLNTIVACYDTENSVCLCPTDGPCTLYTFTNPPIDTLNCQTKFCTLFKC